MAIPFAEALQRLENRRVKSTRPLIPPQILQEDLPLCASFYISCIPTLTQIIWFFRCPELFLLLRLFWKAERQQKVHCTRFPTSPLAHHYIGLVAVSDILRGSDDRLIVVVGCVNLFSSIRGSDSDQSKHVAPPV